MLRFFVHCAVLLYALRLTGSEECSVLGRQQLQTTFSAWGGNCHGCLRMSASAQETERQVGSTSNIGLAAGASLLAPSILRLKGAGKMSELHARTSGGDVKVSKKKSKGKKSSKSDSLGSMDDKLEKALKQKVKEHLNDSKRDRDEANSRPVIMEGLEFRRDKTGMRSLLKKIDKGDFDLDLLDDAKEQLDDPSLDDFGELYGEDEEADQSKKPNGAEVLETKQHQDQMAHRAPNRRNHAKKEEEHTAVDGGMESEDTEDNSQMESFDSIGLPSAETDESTGDSSPNPDVDPHSIVRPKNTKGGKKQAMKTPKKQTRKAIERGITPSTEKRVSFSDSPVQVHHYPAGDQHFVTAEEIAQSISELDSMESEHSPSWNPSDNDSIDEKLDQAQARADTKALKGRGRSNVKVSTIWDDSRSSSLDSSSPKRVFSHPPESHIKKSSMGNDNPSRLDDLAAPLKKSKGSPSKRTPKASFKESYDTTDGDEMDEPNEYLVEGVSMRKADLLKLEDDTGLFSPKVTMEEKLQLLRKAKQIAWVKGVSPFTRKMYLWEQKMQLQPKITHISEK